MLKKTVALLLRCHMFRINVQHLENFLLQWGQVRVHDRCNPFSYLQFAHFDIIKFCRQVVERQLGFIGSIVFFQKREQFLFQFLDDGVNKHTQQHMSTGLIFIAVVDRAYTDIIAFQVTEGMFYVLQFFTLVP